MQYFAGKRLICGIVLIHMLGPLFLFAGPVENERGTLENANAKITKKPGGKWVNHPAEKLPLVVHKVFTSKSNNCKVGYSVFIPDTYSRETEKRYPVVYCLHGNGGNETEFCRIHDTGKINEWMNKEQLPAMILVFANGLHNTGFSDVPGGPQIETAIVGELIPLIDREYRTITSRQGRALIGFSMGGAGALKYLFKHPDTFIAAWTMGAGSRFHYNYSEDQVIADNADTLKGKISIRLSAGTKGLLFARNKGNAEKYKELGLTCEFHPIPGAGHSASQIIKYDKGMFFLDSLRFLADSMIHLNGGQKP